MVRRPPGHRRLSLPGDLFAFVLFAGILIGPFGSAARVFAQIKEAQGAMQRVFEILDTHAEIADAPGAIELPAVRGHVRAEHLSFRLRPRQPVLSDVSFEAKPGELIAIVGPTGSGKTTIMNLLHRFYDPTSGRLTIDGHDVKNVRLDSLYRQIALVPQDTILFGGPIRDNIRYGREDATEEEIIAASTAAHAHEFIVGFPDGYQTIVGEKGINLSGGQRQRVAIARAILKNPGFCCSTRPHRRWIPNRSGWFRKPWNGSWSTAPPSSWLIDSARFNALTAFWC